MNEEELTRALRRLVYTDKLLTLEHAYRYCDLIGLPRTTIDEPNSAGGGALDFRNRPHSVDPDPTFSTGRALRRS